jgi:hypothetical protein
LSLFSRLHTQFGKKFVALAFEFLKSIVVKDEAYCYICKRPCKFVKEKSPENPFEIILWVSGNTCTPWSSSGGRRGWLDRLSIVNLVYLHFLSCTEPDLVINECTPSYDVSVLQQALPSFDCRHLYFGPHDLGLPVSRDRVYSILANLSTLTQTVPWTDELFKSTFGRVCIQDGTMFLTATPEQRKDFMDRVAMHRKIPPRSDGGTWSAKHVMPVGHRQRLDVLMKAMDQKGETSLFIDVTQSFKFRRASDLIPCLMTRSWIYVTTLDTFLSPLEALSVQCLPYALPENDPHRHLSAYQHTFDDATDKVLRQVSGNGMVLPCVGTVLIAALGTCLFKGASQV